MEALEIKNRNYWETLRDYVCSAEGEKNQRVIELVRRLDCIHWLMQTLKPYCFALLFWSFCLWHMSGVSVCLLGACKVCVGSVWVGSGTVTGQKGGGGGVERRTVRA